jgi:hypothetical protein
MNPRRIIILLPLLITLRLCCPDEEFCTYCYKSKTSEFACGLCEQSFFDQKIGLCSKNVSKHIDQCQFYELDPITQATRCKICNLGYRLTASNDCEKCKVEGCAKCSPNNVCTACFGKRTPDIQKNLCLVEPVCQVVNCDVCMYEEGIIKCEVCSKGFAINNRDDRLCAMAKEGCYLIDPIDSTKCLECLSGYYIKKDRTCAPNSKQSLIVWVVVTIVLAIFLLLVGYILYQRSKTIQARREIYNSV